MAAKKKTRPRKTAKTKPKRKRKTNTGKDFELFAQAVFKALHEGAKNVTFHPGQTLRGRTIGNRKVNSHGIDFWWEFRLATTNYKVIIECKDWGRRVMLRDVAAFADVLDDLSGYKGIMVSRVGFQEGAVTRAAAKGIDLYKLDTESRKTVLKKIDSGEELPIGIDVVPPDWDQEREMPRTSKEERLNHEKAIFSGQNALLPGDDFLNMLDLINSDQPFGADLLQRFWRFERHVNRPSNRFLNSKLQKAVETFADATFRLWSRITRLSVAEGTVLPAGMRTAAFRHLTVPMWARNDDQFKRQQAHDEELRVLSLAARQAYDAYRLLVKRAIYV